ncbi:hypothetical protein QQF64_025478 [Cirrhinus molitorella]|uniref:Uncharacterized protein n=1 Tax=Cirrhinus molitorella TaxID=172907 RepID=A0ABR3NP64_9TELE
MDAVWSSQASISGAHAQHIKPLHTIYVPQGGRSSRAILCSIGPHLEGMEVFGSHPGRNMAAGGGPNIFSLGEEDVRESQKTGQISNRSQLTGLFVA